MADSGEFSVEAGAINLVTERLNKGESFIEDGFTGFDVYKSVASLSDKNQREYGIQLNCFPDDKEKTIYKVGEPRRIKAPDGYSGASRVFFHTHPDMADRAPNSILNMTPSYSPKSYDQYFKGDFGNNDWDRVSGGYLNIVNSLGITFLIGQEKHSHSARVVAQARKKIDVATANETNSPILFIKSGQNEGKIIDCWTPEVWKENHLGNEDHLAFTVRLTDLRGDYNLLFVTHSKLEKLGITPREISFGNGINAIVNEMEINLTHAPNVYNALVDYQAYSPI